jgi:MoaA/NifB/PqqE/SkfB family radical SAM enzyme
MSSRELCAQLKALDVSILLGTTSFDPTIESSFVGRDGYHARRDAAIRLLDEFGFNEFIPGQPTRLAFICTPITPMNVDEVFDIYVFARTHNIQPVFAPTMVAGRALGKLLGLIPDEEALLDLYVKINLWNIEHGRTTIEEIESTGVTAYAGGAPCNQVAVGMFIRGTGDVLRCPGNGASFQGNLDEKSLTEIWVKSENLNQFAGKYNCGCPAKEGISFPDNFFEKVMARLKEVLGSQPGDNS